MMETARFLTEVYGEEPVGFFPIWIRPDKKTAWFQDPALAAQHASGQTDKNVYFCIGMYEKALGINRNGREIETIAVTGLGIDIDVLNDKAHEKTNLPPSFEAATELLKTTLPSYLPPTFVINSGHGLQAFWLYKEPWEFDDEDDRIEAKRLSVQFVNTFRLQASHKGWEVDSLPSLAQLFRVPGTNNIKDGQDIKKVQIIEFNEDARYNPADFEEVLVAPQTEKLCLAGGVDNLDYGANPLGLVVSREASPDADMLEMLVDMDPKFASAWKKQGKSRQDNSFSSFDQTLANLAKSYGWTDQDICNLLIAFRREHTSDDKVFRKVLRISYLNRTILKAKETAPDLSNTRAVQNIAKGLKEAAMAIPETMNHTASEGVAAAEASVCKEQKSGKEHIREQVSKALGIRINKILKYTGDEPVFEININNQQRVTLGAVQNLIDQNSLRKHLAAHAGVYLSRYKMAEWDAFATTLLALVEEVETGTDTKDSELIKGWVLYYWNARGSTEDAEAAYVNESPYVRGGKCYIFVRDLRSAMAASGDKYTAKEVGFQLRALDCKQETLMFTLENGKRTSKYAYNVTAIIRGACK